MINWIANLFKRNKRTFINDRLVSDRLRIKDN